MHVDDAVNNFRAPRGFFIAFLTAAAAGAAAAADVVLGAFGELHVPWLLPYLFKQCGNYLYHAAMPNRG